MKKLLLLTTLAISSLPLHAQQPKGSASAEARKMLMEEVREELMRHKPIKIEDALKASQQNTPQLQLKTTATSTEHKVSNIVTAFTEEGEGFIAINPGNPAQLAASYMEQSQNGIAFPIYYTNDSGNTWNKSTFNPLVTLNQDFPGSFLAGGGDPIFAYDKNGKLFFTWIYLVVNQAQDSIFAAMYWASSTNNGQTWVLAPGSNRFIGLCNMDTFTGEPFPGSEGFYDRQWFAVDRSNGPFSGRLYTSFLYIPGSSEPFTDAGTWIKHFNATGNVWNQRTQAYSGISQFANVAVDNNGVLHVSFADIDQQAVMHVSSSNGGQTFSQPHTVYSGFNLFGAQNSNTKVHNRENAAVNMEIDGDNNLHMVWSDYDLPNDNYASFYSRSTNGGLNWSAPVNVNTLLPNSLNGLMPVVSTSGDKVTIGMYGVSGSNTSDYYIVTSDNNGVTWGAAHKVTSVATDFNATSNLENWFGDYFNSVRTDCKVYNIWSDGRGSVGSKMYVSMTRECSSTGTNVQEITPINATFTVNSIYPNPSRNDVHVSISSRINNELQLDVVQMDGKKVLSAVQKIATGDNKLTINIGSLAAGNYMLVVASKDGFRYTRMIERN